ncbi:3-beta-hydroxysteroid-Delta(8),Delta(7)-isomerase-like [Lytechinus pictus]|uniref:3-beta-hydroxysteroid-Delta(8), Delta(7)-isomerase-like n=1 Tax=Lytechinus pictus TaxID=7653 RepID=UPI00240D6085|nr:3-beta-hydroxysteroid-Delta(8),Delta(7)-isomerase-like [Lytechinus pictus]XP_054752120.1 3-beta-hydroxysteroid-Delta(8),Delta(7)-isomerase-like [Lytechinus pictus]
MASNTNHPFNPPSLFVKDYIPNSMTTGTILSIALPGFAIILITVWLMTAKDFHGRPIPVGQRAMLAWFGLCGMIHCILEGYFSVFYQTIPSKTDFLGQIWKEYGKGDSRYVIGDNCTVCVESVTAWLEGPACFLIILAYLRRSPSRYLLQLLVSTGQLYGTIIFFMTEYRDGLAHCKYGDPLYFWVYFISFNVPWVIIPIINIIHCFGHLSAAQASLDQSSQQSTKKAPGNKKKKY